MRKGHRRRGEAPDLDFTTFLNLMVVLIPFLLVSAVFSRVTIMELSVPTGAGPGGAVKPNFSIEVIIRDKGFELANGSSVEAAIPKQGDAYDIAKLSKALLALKAQYPEKQDATLLVEPNIQYENVIHVMDAVRRAEVKVEGSEEVQKIELFPVISIGDAP